MDKRDIYEHLAKIYLDASSKKNKQPKSSSKLFKNITYISFIVIVGLGAYLYSNFRRSKQPFNSETSLVLLHDTAKLNFHFDPAKKEMYSLDLNNLNVSEYKTLSFSVKKSKYEDNISLRVEFFNVFNEQSEIYFKDIPHKWKEYKVELSEFEDITDWTEMTKLSFTLEEWNVLERTGAVLIDNVRLTK